MNEAATAVVNSAASYSPLNTALLMVAIGILGMILRHQIANRKLKLQEEESDRQGFGTLITALQNQVDRLDTALTKANQRIETLEQEKAADHRLIVELLGQLNRTQAAEMRNSNNVSPTLQKMIEGYTE